MQKKHGKKKNNKKRVVQYPFKLFTSSATFSHPIILFEEVKDLKLDELLGVVLYKDEETREYVLLLIKKNEDFLVIPIPSAVAVLLNEKTKSSVIVVNSKFEEIEKKEGKMLPFGREID